MGAILYLVMDMMIHYALAIKMKHSISSTKTIIYAAFIFDAIVLVAFIIVKLQKDPLIVDLSVIIMIFIFALQWIYFKHYKQD